jgi:hypothetical protein
MEVIRKASVSVLLIVGGLGCGSAPSQEGVRHRDAPASRASVAEIFSLIYALTDLRDLSKSSVERTVRCALVESATNCMVGQTILAQAVTLELPPRTPWPELTIGIREATPLSSHDMATLWAKYGEGSPRGHP